MTWNTENTNQKVKVTLMQGGNTYTQEHEPTTTIAEAVPAMAKQYGIKNFSVENEQGNEIEQNEGHKTLGETGPVTIYPEAVGAKVN